MAIYSGKDAFFSGVGASISGLQTWTATRTVTAQRHSHSGVPSATDVPAGIVAWTGTMTGVGGEPEFFFPSGGDITSAVFCARNSATKISLNGTILIEQLSITANKATNAPFQWTATWSAQGNLAKGAGGTTDGTPASAHNSKDLDIVVNDSSLANGTYSTCLQGATLTFRRPHAKFVCNGYGYATAGNLECDLSISILESDPELLPLAVNTTKTVELSVSNSTQWTLEKNRWLSMENYAVNRTTNQLIGYTVTGEWVGADGSIVGPGGTTYIDLT